MSHRFKFNSVVGTLFCITVNQLRGGGFTSHDFALVVSYVKSPGLE